MKETVMDHPRHVAVVAALVRDAEKRILMVRHHKRGWELPQGRVEEGESLADALLREVFEETGVTIVPGPLLAIHSKLTPPAALIFSFLARRLDGDPLPSAETPEVAWLSESEARRRVVHPVNHERLETVLGHRGNLLLKAYETAPFRAVQEFTLAAPGSASDPESRA